MARHLKTEIISSLDRIVSEYVNLPANSAPRARGVRYLTFVEGIDAYFGMMNVARNITVFTNSIPTISPPTGLLPV